MIRLSFVKYKKKKWFEGKCPFAYLWIHATGLVNQGPD